MIDKKKVERVVKEWLEEDKKGYFLVDVEISDDARIVVEIDHAEGVWIDDCVSLSRFIEDHISRDDEDYELEVGSAGIGQPFKVEQQYLNNIGKQVEVMSSGKGETKGKKNIGTLVSVDGRNFTVLVQEKQKQEGKKRPVSVEVEKTFSMDDIKYCKYVIDFK